MKTSEASHGAEIEQIIAEFEERFDHDDPCGKALVIKESVDGAFEQRPAGGDIKSFLTSALARMREETLKECENLVEDAPKGCEDNCFCEDGLLAQGFNTANSFWRERIDELKKK